MQKILFDASNVKSFKVSAIEICAVYCQIQENRLNKNDLLDAVSKVFNYENYAELCAVNKSQRKFYPFSMKNTAHMRSISNDIVKYIDVDVVSLIASVTLVELGVSNLSNVIKSTSGGNIFSFDISKDDPEFILSVYRDAALCRREAVVFSLFSNLYEEAALVLQKKFGIEHNDAVMFKNGPVWWSVADHIKNYINSEKDFSLLCFDINSENFSRKVFVPIYCECGDDEIADLCEDGFGLSELKYLRADVSYCSKKDFILDRLNRYISDGVVNKITLFLPNDEQEKFELSNLSFMRNYACFSSPGIFSAYDEYCENDVAMALAFDDSIEFRYVFVNGRRFVYREPWLSQKERNEILSIDKDIYDFVLSCGNDFAQDFFVGYYINLYNSKRFGRFV